MRLAAILVGWSLVWAVIEPARSATLDLFPYLSESWTVSGSTVTYRADGVVAEGGYAGNQGWLLASGSFNMAAASYSVWINDGSDYSLATVTAGGSSYSGGDPVLSLNGGIGQVPAGTYNIDVQATFTQVAANFIPRLNAWTVSTEDDLLGVSSPSGTTLKAVGVVPLPAALPLFCIALAGLAGLARRQRPSRDLRRCPDR